MPARLQRVCSVFLVEDEAMIRMMVADMLEELGHSVAAEAGSMTNALAMAQTALFDLAILDVNLGGQMIFPVADAVLARDRPIIFATGYSAETIPENYKNYQRLQKPFRIELLDNAIRAALETSR
jgi:DNA-binding response OmpR family regulator